MKRMRLKLEGHQYEIVRLKLEGHQYQIDFEHAELVFVISELVFDYRSEKILQEPRATI